MLDLTLDHEIDSDSVISGCIRVFPAESLPALNSVRGGLPMQQEALLKRKRDIGGCPTWRDDADRIGRGGDFGPLGSTKLGGLILKMVLTVHQCISLQQWADDGSSWASALQTLILNVVKACSSHLQFDTYAQLATLLTCGGVYTERPSDAA
eukprot:TRINITY_DN66575_c0_g1_i1.p2 TRINITY_DN66575_c0_g1~~TRINITY_DN66575_c0_g1_i1.p2  ORF type:complete len:152 (-),score=17.63 TRINITY_DN66575_c0_g1_i1:358-813(-)